MQAARSVAVTCCQLAPQVGARFLKSNRLDSLIAIRKAALAGAQVVVLPELAQSGYAIRDKEELAGLSEPTDGPTLQAWRELSREFNLVIVGGFSEQGADGNFYNSAALLEAGELRAVYRKAHLWDNEKNLFAAGEQPPAVVDTTYGRIALMVCYDLEFPEWVRLASDQGAELLCVPTNWPGALRSDGERPAEVIRVQAAASLNRLFIAACGRIGPERDVTWIGGSVIVDCDGYPVAGPLGANETGTLSATLDLQLARNKWISEHNHLARDRRPELYLAR